jgi:DNA-binding transcriptional ArsR family regulator
MSICSTEGEMNEGTCQTRAIDAEKVARIAGQMKGEGVYQDLSEVFRALGDGSRVQILDAISREELCVCDISAILGMSSSAVSHHLRTLRNLRLVRSRRDGKKVYYSLRDSHVTVLLNQALDHVQHR